MLSVNKNVYQIPIIDMPLKKFQHSAMFYIQPLALQRDNLIGVGYFTLLVRLK